jgi:hypothetical protein
MPVCARAIQQPDGSFLFGLDPAITDLSACAYVVNTGSDEVIASLFSLSLVDASVIGFAVLALWAGCWGIKQLAYLLKDRYEQND